MMKGIKLNNEFVYYPNQSDELKTFNNRRYRYNGTNWFDVENGTICTNKVLYNGKSIIRNGLLIAKRKSVNYCWQPV